MTKYSMFSNAELDRILDQYDFVRASRYDLEQIAQEVASRFQSFRAAMRKLEVIDESDEF